MSAAVGNKRKRSNDILCLNKLSNDMLSMVADYLPKTSRALLAVSLMKNGEPSIASKAIISSMKEGAPYESLMETLFREFNTEMSINAKHDMVSVAIKHALEEPKSYKNYKAYFRKALHVAFAEFSGRNELGDQMREYYNGGWEILDFVDIPLSLASRLTDDDLDAILKCIDAKNNLKRLNLTHCFSVVGHGLESLRGSTVLEKLDLGLVRQMQLPQAFTDLQLSEEVVYNILNDILEVQGNAFQRLQLPMTWSNHGGRKSYPSERLTNLLASVSTDGQSCAFLNENNLCAYFGFNDSKSLMQQYDDNDLGRDKTDRCFGCSWSGQFNMCTHCNKVECYECNDEWPDECNGDECNIVTCGDCRGEGVHNCASSCGAGWCDESRCGECRFRECCNGTLVCEYCKAMVFDRLITENNRIVAENNAKQTAIEQLQRELSQLRAG